jgi:hypothetical protein
MTERDFAGGCHCGAIRCDYRTQLPPHAWSVRACQCTFCRAHAASTTSDPAGTLEFVEVTAGAMNRYRFGQRTASFLLCRYCGVYLGAVVETPRGRFGVLNVRALRNVPPGLPDEAAVSYDDETVEQRLSRREQRWTPIAGTPCRP